MKQPKQSLTKVLQSAHTDEVGLLRIFKFVVVVLLVAILTVAIMIAKQTQKRHETYRALQSLKSELAKLHIEEQRLLIEQQTFGATSQVARRADIELKMQLPSKDQRRVISVPVPPQPKENQP